MGLDQRSLVNSIVAASLLGGVDGFDDDEAESEGDDRAEVLGGFLASECDTLEALEFAHELLDASPCAVERLGEEPRPVLGP